MGAPLPLPARDQGIASLLAGIRRSCNRLGRLERDPLALVRPYADVADREIAGFVAATLAFGRVDLILSAVRAALGPLGPRPATALDGLSEGDIGLIWSGFQYRFCFSKDIVALLVGLKRARAEYGGLEALFGDCDSAVPPVSGAGDPTVAGALSLFSRRINDLAIHRETVRRSAAGLRRGLVPEPSRGSACKRLFLFLRWMVRKDEVDPGGWTSVSTSRLVVPLDVHMARVCHERLGFIPTPAATLANALRATACFRIYAPRDPVKFDFALTRPGIDPAEGDEVWGCG